MSISLENWIRNKLHENEEMHDYAVATDSVRVWIDEWKLESQKILLGGEVVGRVSGNSKQVIIISGGGGSLQTMFKELDTIIKLDDNQVPMEVVLPIKNYDLPMPIVKQAPKFPPEEPKPHPTSWRQSNRHYKRRK